MRTLARALTISMLLLAPFIVSQDTAKFHATEGDFVAYNFKFRSGEQLSELRLHYTTFGQPVRDSQGHVANAVLLLHGTGGSGHQFFAPQFADELFGPGQPLDLAHYYVIAPDGIGHGKSSKPSDGMHAHFPQYDYDDMVAAQHLLLTEALHVDHLRLLFGTSMGCMHAFVWGETYPTFMDAMMPMACLPVQIAGRNRMWREMLMEGIRHDPEWQNGDYKEEPKQALRAAQILLVIAGSAPVLMQNRFPTREAADKYVNDSVEPRLASLDANDLLYQVNASRNYDPSPHLEDIVARVTWINSADDFINPPELGIAEKQGTRLKNGIFILLPISENTHGHGTHTWAIAWKQYMEGILGKTTR